MEVSEIKLGDKVFVRDNMYGKMYSNWCVAGTETSNKACFSTNAAMLANKNGFTVIGIGVHRELSDRVLILCDSGYDQFVFNVDALTHEAQAKFKPFKFPEDVFKILGKIIVAKGGNDFRLVTRVVSQNAMNDLFNNYEFVSENGDRSIIGIEAC